MIACMETRCGQVLSLLYHKVSRPNDEQKTGKDYV